MLRSSRFSEFSNWQASKPKGATTLHQQVTLAKRLYDEALGPEENPPTIDEIIQSYDEKTDCFIEWKGVNVYWFLHVFCESPYLMRLREFGCELWFVRKVCVPELLRRRGGLIITKGPLVKFLDEWNEEDAVDDDLKSKTPSVVDDPTTFLSYTGRYTLDFLIGVLKHNPDEICRDDFFWMDIFCVNQHAWTGLAHTEELRDFKDGFMDDLGHQIRKIGRTMLILDQWKNPTSTLGQIWVLWEIYNTADAGAELNLLLPQDQTDHFGSVFEGVYESEDADVEAFLRQPFSELNTGKAVAENKDDHRLVLRRMEQKGLSETNSFCRRALSEALFNIVDGKNGGWMVNTKGSQALHIALQSIE